MYFDAAYVAKFLEESDSDAVRAIASTGQRLKTSAFTTVEFHAVLHRKVREGSISSEDAWVASLRLTKHVTERYWRLSPVPDKLLRTTARMLLNAPPGLFLRAGDAIHLTTAS